MIGYLIIGALTIATCIGAAKAESALGMAGYAYIAVIGLILMAMWRARKDDRPRP